MLLIDEIAALTGWITDRTMRKRIDSALSLLLTQGRAVGVVVVGAIQDPRKDVIPQRDLFTIRIGLRVNEAEHVRLSLGSDAYNRGAACELIPDTLPGVAYVAQDGIPDPVRVRFAWHTDDDIAQLVAPPAAVVPLDLAETRRGLTMLRYVGRCWSLDANPGRGAAVPARTLAAGCPRCSRSAAAPTPSGSPAPATPSTPPPAKSCPRTTPRTIRTGSRTCGAGIGGRRCARPAPMSTRATSGTS